METTKCLGPKPMVQRTHLEYQGAHRVNTGMMYFWKRGLDMIYCVVEGTEHRWSQTGKLGYIVPTAELLRKLDEAMSIDAPKKGWFV